MEASDTTRAETVHQAGDMAASTRLFAIPELLELILLQMYNEDDDPDIESLFRLQRVNHTFCRTILDSLPIRQQMGIEYHVSASDPRRMGPSRSTMWFLGRRGIHLGLPNVLVPRRNSASAVTVFSTGPDKPLFLTWPSLKSSQEDYAFLAHQSIAKETQRLTADCTRNVVEPSWWRCKLLRKSQDCILQVPVEIGAQPHKIEYVFALHWSAGSDTLGDFFDAFVRVARRTKAEHTQFASAQRAARIHSIIFNDMKMQSEQPGKDYVKDVIPNHRAATRKMELKWLEQKGAHDRLSDCGKRRGECHVCHAEAWYANRYDTA